MNGIVAAFEGHLAADAELRFTAQGQPLCSFNVAVWDAKKAQGADTEWVKVALWGDEAERLAPTLRKGAEVYVHGRLRLNTWQGQDGQQRSGLNCSAWEVTVKGAIGRKAPKRPAGDGMPEWSAVGAAR